ncbi:glutamine-hydrolyzing carbamoyl-phosphate synthase small subunit [Listeria monocytogenes]|uniref:carbamoyl phosphate synthase small subunit n=1 Tax=Listeria monocytogenes TaxID=1639 RepID=UPI000F20EA1F|nr:carbamoyl phosphate synthase small subunit [Listeria monocytogenes]AYY71765.1 carbamoyl-phosphate synthase small subunit [Listeria monocytogenes]EAC8984141.1 carbamoyl-phosphate synthase small subunit [Listeria monocytogenes]EAF1672931.1 carbamoyl-phosphate synthase small subunit [Listeria monocytogenes]EAV9807485.1 glutamine-hydrolyzing carbamoyl-phosphate synthase small subunit [Listeria monocytogenes]EAW7207946.1 glutamine-hydrolyzing carbamoyl-phosphate synthase small subunit [Listeria 
MTKRILMLEDGNYFIGDAIGSEKETIGEVVFNTGMTGYQETITDPSYYGQIITFTYPLVGNYGVNRDDFESINPAVKGVVVREAAEFPSNWRNQITLDEFLKEKGIPGIAGIDTRKLTKLIRKEGTLKGILAAETANKEELLHHLRSVRLPVDQVHEVSSAKAFASPGDGKRVVLVDYGVKSSILRELNKRNCYVTVVPYNTTAEEILAMHPDGVMLSNGPGDPKDVPEALEMIRGIQGKLPLFGICLGHQLFALANGADTFKLKFGHRGANHPVKELATGRVDFTAQNHGYAVEKDSLIGTDLKVTHIELNDETVEGLAHKEYPAYTVQYHPEANPGPSDVNYLFDEFIEMMNGKEEGELHA